MVEDRLGEGGMGFRGRDLCGDPIPSPHPSPLPMSASMTYVSKIPGVDLKKPTGKAGAYIKGNAGSLNLKRPPFHWCGCFSTGEVS